MGNDLKKEEANANDPRFLPQGLYPAAGQKWDKKVLMKMIIDKKLSPYQKGLEDLDPNLPDLEECPICFLYYNGGLNRALCCGKGVCTECYVHIRPPVNIAPTICPFCQVSGYTAEFKGPLSQEVRDKEKAEEKKVKEIELRMRLEEIEQDRKREEDKKRRLSTQNSPSSTPGTGSSPYPLNRDSSRPLIIPSKPTPQPTMTPANSVVSPSSIPYLPQFTTDDDDLEDKMLQEAIRLSLETASHTH